MTETWNAGVRSRIIDADETTNDDAVVVGDLRESFGAFYQRELRAVTGLAYVLSGSRAAAEDITQDAFIGAYRWDRLSAYDDPGAWVRRVVANRAISGYRRRMTEMRGLLRLGRERPTDPPGAHDGAFGLDAQTERLWSAVRKLPARQAQAIVLKHLEGRSVAETAAILGCSENTVKTHRSRGRQALAQRLTSATPDTSDEGDHR